MPIYVYKCEGCGFEDEVIQPISTNGLNCSRCGAGMTKKPTHHSFVYMKGKGGYPSFRKRYLGTAPGTSSISPFEHKGGHGSKLPAATTEGEKWLESLE